LCSHDADPLTDVCCCAIGHCHSQVPVISVHRMGKQLALPLVAKPRKRKKRRDGATNRRRVVHRKRPHQDARHPVHVTLRVLPGLASLRTHGVAGVIGRGLRVAALGTARRQIERRASFRVVHFSIQSNHVHLIVEATDRVALARGMQGLASSMARRVNRLLGRRGTFFSDRYHAHQMRAPREVRNGIVYVLKNFEKHPDIGFPDLGTMPMNGVDPCSSGRWFNGWRTRPPPQETPTPVAAPKTWLLRVGWWHRGGGLIARDERPAARL
jgi:REP element-mobilizing transposase RayT